jgi:hypothetical protein
VFSISTSQSALRTDRAPRSLILLGVCVALALTLVLLRYAIDLLGLVFVIVVVGFSIQAVTDWLTDGESVSFWSIAAVCTGLVGTALVATWLWGSRTILSGRVDVELPTFMSETIAWAESKGWGDRVILTGPDEKGPALRELRIPYSSTALGGGRDERTVSTRGSDTSIPNAASGGASSSAERRDGSAVSTLVTSTSLSVTPAARVPLGHPVHLLAVVRAAELRGELPDGTVVFWRDDVVLGSASLRKVASRAVAAMTTRDLPAGQLGLSAEYVGTQRFRTSRSPVVPHLIVEP